MLCHNGWEIKLPHGFLLISELFTKQQLRDLVLECMDSPSGAIPCPERTFLRSSL